MLGTIILWTVLGLLTLILITMSVRIISQQTIGIVETFGKYSRTMNPGLNFVIPFVQSVVKRVNLRVRELPVEVAAKTKDEVFFKLPVNVQVKVTKPEDSYYKLDDPFGQMESYILNQVRSSAASMELKDVYEDKATLEQNVAELLKSKFEGYGFKIVNVLIDDPQLDKSIRDAANAVIAAKRTKEAATHNAAATKITVVAKAEADAEAKRLSGKGFADQRKEIVDGYQDSIDALRKAMPKSNDETLAAIVSQLAWMDTQRDMVADNKNLVLMPYGSTQAPEELARMAAAFKASK